MKNVYRAFGVGSFPLCRLFVVLFFGSFVWCASLNAAGSISFTAEAGQVRVIASTSGAQTTSCGIIWVFLQTSSQAAAGFTATGGDGSKWPNQYTSYFQIDARPQFGLPSSMNQLKPLPMVGGRYLAQVVDFQDVNPYIWKSIQYVIFNAPDPAQTVTLSPNGGAASLVAGQSFAGTASGAQAGNPYNISIVSGQGSASINSSTGAYTIISNGAGLITYKVWASAGGGFSRSDDAQASIAVAVSKQVRVTIPANNGAFVKEHKLVDSVTGVQIPGTGVLTQMPGAGAYILTVDVPSGNDVVLLTKVIGAAKDDNGNWVVDDEAVTDLDPSPPITPETPSTDPAAPNAPVTPPIQATPTGTTAGNSPKGRITWSAGTQSSDPTQQTDLLTNATFREGVQNIVDGIDLREEDEKKTDEAITKVDGVIAQGLVDMELAVADALSKASQITDAVESRQWVGPTLTKAPQSGGLSYGVAGTSFQFSLNPIGNPKLPSWVGDLMNFARLIIAVTALGMLYMDIHRKFREAFLGVLQINREGEFNIERKVARMASTIPWAGGFVGGLLGAGLRLAVFALFIATILTMPAILITALDNMSSLGFDSYKDSLQTVMNSGGVMSLILGMSVAVVPIPTLLAIFATRMVSETLLNMAILPIGFYIKVFKL